MCACPKRSGRRWAPGRPRCDGAGALVLHRPVARECGANVPPFDHDSVLPNLHDRSALDFPGDPEVLRGTYTVSGNVATLVFRPGTPGTVPGIRYMMRFSVFHDRLTWSKIPGRVGLDALPAVPWTRVR